MSYRPPLLVEAAAGSLKVHSGVSMYSWMLLVVGVGKCILLLVDHGEPA